MTEILTADNWYVVVQEAVADLPADYRAGIDCTRIDDGVCVVTVAGEATDWMDRGARSPQVTVTYWDSLRACGWPPEHEELYRSDGIFADRLTWPVISMLGESTSLERGLFPGRATTADMKRHLQAVIKAELPQGSVSAGRLIRKARTRNLSRQSRKRSDHG